VAITAANCSALNFQFGVLFHCWFICGCR